MHTVNFLNLEYFYNLIYRIFTTGFDFQSIIDFIRGILDRIAPLSAAISVFALFVIIYAVWRILEIRKAESEALEVDENIFDESSLKKNKHWEEIQKHISSEHPSEWKEAILEADSMLDSMLEEIGYHGDGVGEKLKSIESSDFITIDSAWEAHKVRNSIAHQDAGFLITKREADRVIRLYQKVFEEFKYI